MSIEDQVDQTTILWLFQQSKTIDEVSIYILRSQKNLFKSSFYFRVILKSNVLIERHPMATAIQSKDGKKKVQGRSFTCFVTSVFPYIDITANVILIYKLNILVASFNPPLSIFY